MNTGFRGYVVSDDPAVVSRMRERFQRLDSLELATFAHSIGLYPPGYEDGQQHSICSYTPPGHDGDPYFVWEIGLDSPDTDDQVPEVWEDGEDPWAGMVDIVDTPSDNKDNSE